MPYIINFSVSWYDRLRTVNFTHMEITLTICVFSRRQVEWWQSYMVSLFLLSYIHTSWIIRLILWDSILLICSSTGSVTSLWVLIGKIFENLLIDLFDLLKSLSVGLFFIGKIFDTLIECVFEFWDSVTGFAWESCRSVSLGLINSSTGRFGSCSLVRLSLIGFGVTVVRAHVN